MTDNMGKDTKQSAALVETPFGQIFVAELEDGTVHSVSPQTAINDLNWVIENADLPEAFDSTSLEILREFLRTLVPERG